MAASEGRLPSRRAGWDRMLDDAAPGPVHGGVAGSVGAVLAVVGIERYVSAVGGTVEVVRERGDTSPALE